MGFLKDLRASIKSGNVGEAGKKITDQGKEIVSKGEEFLKQA